MKDRSIFKALDGAHLDGSIFDAHLSRDKTRDKTHAKSEPKTVFGRYSFWRRRARPAASGKARGKTGPDTRL